MTKKELTAEVERLRVERSRLLTLIEKMYDEAASESQHHQTVRTRLEDAAKAGREDLAFQAELKLGVDERLKVIALYLTRSERIVKNIPVGIAYLDQDLKCRWANPAFAHLVKIPFDQIVGRNFREAFPAAQAGASELLREVISKGKLNRPVRLPFLHSVQGDDQPTYWDVLAIPVVGSEDDVDGILVAIEVTERVARERALREYVAQQPQLDRLKCDFIDMVSHELRTPLSTIAGYAEFLEDELGGPLTPEQREHVMNIQNAEEHISRIVDDLLDCARLEAGVFTLALETFDLVDLVEHELAVLRPLCISARMQPRAEVCGTPLLVLADHRRIAQVLYNLIGNAIKFTPAGGSVLVKVECSGGDARVTVTDTGIGIDAMALRRVFDKFFQADSSSTRTHGGAGIGLALSKMLIERQGGTIGAVSEPGKGSTFWFTLPLRDGRGPY